MTRCTEGAQMADNGRITFAIRHGLRMGDLISAASGNRYRVISVVDDRTVIARRPRWYDRLILWWISR